MKGHIKIFIAFLIFGLFGFVACNYQGSGFALPEGNEEQGKITFEELGCNSCHNTSEVTWLDMGDDINLTLGGEVSVAKTYAYLVTSIINPDHKIATAYKKIAEEKGKSEMLNYNDLMTVQELVDVVTYLRKEYRIKVPSTYNRYY